MALKQRMLVDIKTHQQPLVLEIADALGGLSASDAVAHVLHKAGAAVLAQLKTPVLAAPPSPHDTDSSDTNRRPSPISPVPPSPGGDVCDGEAALNFLGI